jgi:hypothetical protein
MTTITPTDRAEMIARSNAATAHHEAGHAVAVVARGGRLVKVVITQADPHHPDWDSEWAGFTRHRTPVTEHPFTTFAGPWAEAMWASENDPDTSFNEALDDAWENSADGDAAYYAELCEPVWEAARRAGLGPRVGPEWEVDWDAELEHLWPAICAVAEMLLAGETVTHDVVGATLAAAGVDADEAVA